VSSIVERPRRLFSFSDHSRTRPREPIPADRLDEQIAHLIDAIASTQRALADIRRDDGRLRNASVGPDQLAVGVGAQLQQLADTHLGRLTTVTETLRSVSTTALRDVAMYARDAEAAAGSAAQFLTATDIARKLTETASADVRAAAVALDADAVSAENWGAYSKAQADNAIAAKDQSLQWAEYLAGPVVNAAEAPAYISGSPFPHGLYYQPVEGFGGVAGLWSAKWWAVYAAQLVGGWMFLYLGGWDHPPTPGETNPATGIKVPNPILAGSIYYNTVEHQLYVWDGDSWNSPHLLDAGLVDTYVYTATANQSVFSGPDDNGRNPAAQLGTHPYDVHVNGVKLVANDDYTVTGATATLTLTDPVTAGTVVQWDILVSRDELAPGAVNAFKMIAFAPDGVKTQFPLQYLKVGVPTNASVGDGTQLFVVIDGVTQEPGSDYTALGSTLSMQEPPRADAHFWAVWYQPVPPVGGAAGVAPPLMDATPAIVGTSLSWAHEDHRHPSDTSRAAVTYVDSQDALKVAKTGDTMTGVLSVTRTNPVIALNKTASGQGNSILGTTAGATRWQVDLGNSTAEGGGNSGSNFGVYRYNDAGVIQDDVLTILRSDASTGFRGKMGIGPPPYPAGYTLALKSAVTYAIGIFPGADNLIAIHFNNAAAAAVGNITCSSTATAYNTSSDGRLKEDIKALSTADAGNIIDDTEVYDFRWKETGTRDYGVIAQQAKDVYGAPMFHDIKDDRWFVDYSKYVPVLLRELQALRARMAEVEVAAGLRPAAPGTPKGTA
jgi:hypothetical protein